jgi:hypothetical protein
VVDKTATAVHLRHVADVSFGAPHQACDAGYMGALVSAVVISARKQPRGRQRQLTREIEAAF